MRRVPVLLLAFSLGYFSFLRAIGKPRALALLEALPPVCPLRIYFGWKCAFCGMTHAFLHLAFFDWKDARAENALAIPLVLGFGILFALFALNRRPAERVLKAGSLAAVFVLLGYAILRNL